MIQLSTHVHLFNFDLLFYIRIFLFLPLENVMFRPGELQQGRYGVGVGASGVRFVIV